MTAEPLDRGPGRLRDPQAIPGWAAPPTHTAELRLLPSHEPYAANDYPVVAPMQSALHRLALHYVQAVVEIVEGNRSPSQLLRCASPRVYHDVIAQAGGRAGTRGSGKPGRRIGAHVVSVKVFEPRAGIAEVAAHVRYGVRSGALAARFELAANRWVCTALDWGLDRG